VVNLHVGNDQAQVIGPARLAYFTPVHEQPTLADRKAMFILGASGLMASVLLFFSHQLGTLARAGGALTSICVLLLLAAVGAMVVVAAVVAYYAYTRPLPPMPDTLAFFRSVADRPADSYRTDMTALDHLTALRGMLHYNYSVASLASQKFRLVNRSLACLKVAIPLWMALLLVLAVLG